MTGNFIEFPIEWCKPHLFRNDEQNKVTTSSGKWRKNCILEFQRLWKTPADEECCSGGQRPYNEAFTTASSFFPGWPGNCPDLKLMNSREFKLRSCRIKNVPCQKLG